MKLSMTNKKSSTTFFIVWVISLFLFLVMGVITIVLAVRSPIYNKTYISVIESVEFNEDLQMYEVQEKILSIKFIAKKADQTVYVEMYENGELTSDTAGPTDPLNYYFVAKNKLYVNGSVVGEFKNKYTLEFNVLGTRLTFVYKPLKILHGITITFTIVFGVLFVTSFVFGKISSKKKTETETPAPTTDSAEILENNT